jgi:hypothetical protein
MTRAERITFGELRDMGLRGVPIYCADYRCSHSVALSADRWDDSVRPSRFSLAPSAASAARMFGLIFGLKAGDQSKAPNKSPQSSMLRGAS